ncbi:MAG: cache domain-containing protein [Pseudomonadota bacterium]
MAQDQDTADRVVSTRGWGGATRLRLMVLLLAVLPLVLAIAAVVWVVRKQSDQLALTQIEALQPLLLQARKDELQHFVQVGRKAIAHLSEKGGKDPAAQRQALELLRRMDFGDNSDNYFFVYDLQGNSLMHPRLAQLEGRSAWDLQDSAGSLIIQRLIAQARAGGGFVDYVWNRPSTGLDERKLGYVEMVPQWEWMVGTGLYLDHLRTTEKQIKTLTAQAVAKTRDQILLIALVAVLWVAAGGFALNWYEQRAADAKLRAMAHKVVLSQEAERARVARELHDGISQCLVSLKFVFESALVHLERGNGDASTTLRNGLHQMRDVMRDVRRISHDLRPTILDDVGLGGAIAQTAREFGERSGITIHTRVEDFPPLRDTAATALFRFAQEALGNIERHAGAQQAWVTLRHSGKDLELVVRDDGRGFDVQATLRQVRDGLGLTHMRERIETLGGRFELQSSPGATVLTARLPTAVSTL